MKVLLIDDHPLVLSALTDIIHKLDARVQVRTADGPDQAFAQLAQDDDIDLVLLDPLLADGVDGFALLADLRPAGQFLMEDFHDAGGMPGLLLRLKDLLHTDCRTISGRTLGEDIAGAEVFSDEVIATREKPVAAEGGMAVLTGNLAPDGCVIKHTAMESRFLKHRGPALVFRDYPDLKARIDLEDLRLELRPDREVLAEIRPALRAGVTRGDEAARRATREAEQPDDEARLDLGRPVAHAAAGLLPRLAGGAPESGDGPALAHEAHIRGDDLGGDVVGVGPANVFPGDVPREVHPVRHLAVVVHRALEADEVLRVDPKQQASAFITIATPAAELHLRLDLEVAADAAQQLRVSLQQHVDEDVWYPGSTKPFTHPMLGVAAAVASTTIHSKGVAGSCTARPMPTAGTSRLAVANVVKRRPPITGTANA